jgi:hypothetical protein
MSSVSYLWFVGLIVLLALIWAARSTGRRRPTPEHPAPRGDLKSGDRAEDDRPGDIRQ